MFEEADYNGKKYFTFLVGELGSEPKPPYLMFYFQLQLRRDSERG